MTRPLTRFQLCTSKVGFFDAFRCSLLQLFIHTAFRPKEGGNDEQLLLDLQIIHLHSKRQRQRLLLASCSRHLSPSTPTSLLMDCAELSIPTPALVQFFWNTRFLLAMVNLTSHVLLLAFSFAPNLPVDVIKSHPKVSKICERPNPFLLLHSWSLFSKYLQDGTTFLFSFPPLWPTASNLCPPLPSSTPSAPPQQNYGRSFSLQTSWEVVLKSLRLQWADKLSPLRSRRAEARCGGGRMALMVWSVSATHTSNWTRCWCLK